MTEEMTYVDELYNAFPTWLKEASSMAKESVLKWNDGENFILSHPDYEERSFSSVYKAYHYANNAYDAPLHFEQEFFENNKVFTFGMQEGDTTPEEAYKDHLVYRTLLNNTENPYSMISETNASWVYGIQRDFEDFFEIRHQYMQDRYSFEKAYNFVREHPMSWVRIKPEHTVKTLWYPHEQESLFPIFSETPGDSSYSWSLETGSHEEPDYVRRYFDWELSVFSASSPEAAYIELARKIEERFLPTGEEK